MSLTLEQADQAGALAAAIRAADAALAGLDSRIAESAEITTMIAQLAGGKSVRAEIEMTATESAAVFNAVRTIVQAKRDALAAMLSGIG